MGVAIIQPPTVDAYSLAEYLEGAAAGGMAGGVIGAAAGGGVGGIPGAIAGMLIVPITMWLTESNSESQISDDNAEVYAKNLRNNTMRAMESYWQMAVNQVNLFDTSGFMYARYAASAANALYDYQEANSLPHDYSAEYIFSQSPIMKDLISILYYSNECYNNLFRGYADLSATFTGDYASMKWGIYNAQADVGATYDQDFTLMFTNEILAAGTVNYPSYVYLPANATLYGVVNNAWTAGEWHNDVIGSDGTYYLHDTNASTIGANVGDVVEYKLNNPIGKYHIGNYPFGKVTFYGTAAPDIVNPGTIKPAILPLYDGGGVLKSSGGVVRVDQTQYHAIGTSYDMSDNFGIFFNRVSTIGTILGDPYYFIPVMKHLNALYGVQENYDDMITIANNAGQTQFNAQVASNGTAPRISPDIIYLDPNQMQNMTWQQQYAVYIAYLNAMKGYFENYSALSPGSVNISVDSFDLICEGSIYSPNGTMLYGPDTVFTPYISLHDETLVLGPNNMSQPGFIIVWSTNEGMSAVDMTNATKIEYVQYSASTVLNVTAMYYKGAPVTTHTMEVTELVWVYGDQSQNENPPPQSMTDTAWLLAHWYLAAMVLGVVVLLGAVMTRSTVVLAIGIIAILAGLAGWYLAGDTIFGIKLAIEQAGQWIIWR